MADKKAVWVQNTHSGDVLIRVKLADDAGRVTFTEQLFPNYRVDKMTGRVRHSGYTELTGEEFDFFSTNSPLFKKFLVEQKLISYDSPPPGAVNPAEQIILLRSEIAALKAQLAGVTSERDALKSRSKQKGGGSDKADEGAEA